MNANEWTHLTCFPRSSWATSMRAGKQANRKWCRRRFRRSLILPLTLTQTTKFSFMKWICGGFFSFSFLFIAFMRHSRFEPTVRRVSTATHKTKFEFAFAANGLKYSVSCNCFRKSFLVFSQRTKRSHRELRHRNCFGKIAHGKRMFSFRCCRFGLEWIWLTNFFPFPSKLIPFVRLLVFEIAKFEMKTCEIWVAFWCIFHFHFAFLVLPHCRATGDCIWCNKKKCKQRSTKWIRRRLNIRFSLTAFFVRVLFFPFIVCSFWRILCVAKWRSFSLFLVCNRKSIPFFINIYAQRTRKLQTWTDQQRKKKNRRKKLLKFMPLFLSSRVNFLLLFFCACFRMWEMCHSFNER